VHRYDHDPVRFALTFLARRRWAGVGLALVAELAALAGLALAPPSTVVGIPAAVAAAIAGTVAVVFGVLDGVLVAFAGALVFAATGGWGAGELAALAVWPGIVAAVGLFARRIAYSRIALEQVLSAQERERKRLALELHDQTAQMLASALMLLRAAGSADDGSATAEAGDQARQIISETIQALRALAVELSPTALADYGLTPALERLTATLSDRSGIDVHLESSWNDRAGDEVELTLFRVVQNALAAALAGSGGGQSQVTWAMLVARLSPIPSSPPRGSVGDRFWG
jgi:signal transduction histidine kinase